MDEKAKEENSNARGCYKTPRRRIYAASRSPHDGEREKGGMYAVGIYNYALLHALILPFAILLSDSYEAGTLYLNLQEWYTLLGPISDWVLVAGILAIQFLFSFLLYFIFLFWAACYRRGGKVVNNVFLLLFVGSVLVSHRLVFLAVYNLRLHPAGSVACCTQQVLLCMKWISFVYENSYKVLYPWHKDDKTGPAVWYEGQMEPQIGSFSSYVFFIFCPVLLYRDRYPRKSPNPRKAVFYFFVFLVTTAMAYTTFNRYMAPKSMRMDDLVTSLLRCLFLGFIQLTLGHTSLLYGWCNAWAELIGFADQNFYQDWWNSDCLGEYLAKWNGVIYDWLKAYPHTILKRFVPRPLAVFLILVLSSVEHDFLISVGMGFFLPMYFIQYGITGFLVSLKPSLGKQTDQLTMCLLLSVGSGLQVAVYLTELVARTQCPDPGDEDKLNWFEGLRAVQCYRQFND